MAKCEGCGAHLPARAAGSSVTCTYCGVATTLPPPRDHGPPAAPRSALTPQGSSGLGWLIGITIFVVVALGIGAAVALAIWAELDAYTRVQDVVPGVGDRSIDPAGLPTPFGALDPIAVYPWALARAREWAPDATLTSFTVRGITMDGRANAVATGSTSDGPDAPGADLFFESPARMRAARSMRQVSTQQVMTGLRIRMREGLVRAVANTSIDADDATPAAFPQPACSLAQVIATMRANGLEMRPAYELIADGNRGRWAWRVNMTGLPDTPIVFADDCAVRQ